LGTTEVDRTDQGGCEVGGDRLLETPQSSELCGMLWSKSAPEVRGRLGTARPLLDNNH